MTRRPVRLKLLLGAALCLVTWPASATFHFMQIEQIVAGVCGDARAQVVQLRMRAAGQSSVSGTRLIATDASGANPVTLIVMPGNVTTGTVGSRILIASPAAAAELSGEDFVMTATIPVSYLAAGRLVFTDSAGTTIYWSVSWGGAGYTGSNAGNTANDADGNFGPPFATALLFNTSQGLLFQGAATAMSTNNAADYAYTADDATFVNNAGATVPLADDCVFGDGFETGNTAQWTAVVP